MGVFIFIVIVVVVIVFVVRENKRAKFEKAIEELKSHSAYAAAVEIRDELSRNGYEIEEYDYANSDGIPVGWWTVRSKEKRKIGDIHFSYGKYALNVYGVWSLQRQNGPYIYQSAHYYAIENANTNVLVASTELSQTIPHFLKIAAEVMVENSKYLFEHPDWFYKDPKVQVYLNVGLTDRINKRKLEALLWS